MRRVKVFIVMAVLSGGVFGYAHLKKTGLYDVLEIYDGDTIAVRMSGKIEKIRLIGIDTPETKDPRKPVQCFGPEASDYSHKKLSGAKVRLQADPLSTNRDRYDRLLRYVYLDDGSLYNASLLDGGFARAYTGFPFSKSETFKGAEAKARAEQKGLWASCATLANEGD